MGEVLTAHFWVGLMTIIWVNVILSADNAVVIALAARSLPKRLQGKAMFWGAGAALAVLIILTAAAAELLKFPFLRIIGGLILLWIAVNLLLPNNGVEDGESSDKLSHAIKTILIADLIMSLDNVIAVAAVAKGNIVLLVLGLVISIPLVVFGAAVVVKIIKRFPILVTIGAALIGWVAGEMLVTDPVLVEWIDTNMAWVNVHLPLGLGEVSLGQVAGAVFVVAFGKWLAAHVGAGKSSK